MRADRGFSVVETLLALLLFAIGLTALLHYQQALTQGFYRQWQQQEAWRIAALRLQEKRAKAGPPRCKRCRGRRVSAVADKRCAARAAADNAESAALR